MPFLLKIITEKEAMERLAIAGEQCRALGLPPPVPAPMRYPALFIQPPSPAPYPLLQSQLTPSFSPRVSPIPLNQVVTPHNVWGPLSPSQGPPSTFGLGWSGCPYGSSRASSATESTYRAAQDAWNKPGGSSCERGDRKNQKTTQRRRSNNGVLYAESTDSTRSLLDWSGAEEEDEKEEEMNNDHITTEPWPPLPHRRNSPRSQCRRNAPIPKKPEPYPPQHTYVSADFPTLGSSEGGAKKKERGKQ